MHNTFFIFFLQLLMKLGNFEYFILDILKLKSNNIHTQQHVLKNWEKKKIVYHAFILQLV